MALRPFHLGAAALRIDAVTLSFVRTLYGRAQIIFFLVYKFRSSIKIIGKERKHKEWLDCLFSTFLKL